MLPASKTAQLSPRSFPPLPGVRDGGLAQHAPLEATQVGNVLAPAPQPLSPTARPRPQRALPATLRRGARPDSAARGRGEGRNLGAPPRRPRWPADGLNLHEHEPMARASFLGPESQSDDEARPAAGKTTPPEEGEGGRPLARELLSLTLPPLPRPARGRPRPHVQLASPHLPPAPPSGQSEAAGGCALRLPLTDRRLTPTKTRHLCFHTRREEKKPISDETSAGSAPPLPPPPRAMAASGGDFSAPFSLPLRLLQGGPHSCPPPACPFQRHDSYPAVSQNGSTTLGGPAAAAHPRKRTKPPSRQSPDPLPSRGSLPCTLR